jgi:hypothetical protein
VPAQDTPPGAEEACSGGRLDEKVEQDFAAQLELRGIKGAIAVLKENGVTNIKTFSALRVEDLDDMKLAIGHQRVLTRWLRAQKQSTSVEAWLRSIRLAQYASALTEFGYDSLNTLDAASEDEVRAMTEDAGIGMKAPHRALLLHAWRRRSGEKRGCTMSRDSCLSHTSTAFGAILPVLESARSRGVPGLAAGLQRMCVLCAGGLDDVRWSQVTTAVSADETETPEEMVTAAAAAEAETLEEKVTAAAADNLDVHATPVAPAMPGNESKSQKEKAIEAAADRITDATEKSSPLGFLNFFANPRMPDLQGGDWRWWEQQERAGDVEVSL